MDIKTNLHEEYINFIDNIKKRNTKLWICSIILFILIIITIRYIQLYLYLYLGILTNI